MGCQLQQLSLPKLLSKTACGEDARDTKHAFGKRTRLIKHHILGLGQRLQIIGSLHQNAAGGRSPDASEKA